MNVHLVESMDEVLRQALAGPFPTLPPPAPERRPDGSRNQTLRIEAGSRFSAPLRDRKNDSRLRLFSAARSASDALSKPETRGEQLPPQLWPERGSFA